MAKKKPLHCHIDKKPYGGKQTKGIYIRLPIAVIFALEARAKAKGFQLVSAYIKDSLLKAIYHSDITTKDNSSRAVSSQNNQFHSDSTTIPIYDALIHLPGDTVRIWNPATKAYKTTIL